MSSVSSARRSACDGDPARGGAALRALRDSCRLGSAGPSNRRPDAGGRAEASLAGDQAPCVRAWGRRRGGNRPLARDRRGDRRRGNDHAVDLIVMGSRAAVAAPVSPSDPRSTTSCATHRASDGDRLSAGVLEEKRQGPGRLTSDRESDRRRMRPCGIGGGTGARRDRLEVTTSDERGRAPAPREHWSAGSWSATAWMSTSPARRASRRPTRSWSRRTATTRTSWSARSLRSSSTSRRRSSGSSIRHGRRSVPRSACGRSPDLDGDRLPHRGRAEVRGGRPSGWRPARCTSSSPAAAGRLKSTKSVLDLGHEVALIEQRRDRWERLEEEFEHRAQLGDATGSSSWSGLELPAARSRGRGHRRR